MVSETSSTHLLLLLVSCNYASLKDPGLRTSPGASHAYSKTCMHLQPNNGQGLEVFFKTHRRPTVYRAPGRFAPCPYADFAYAYAGPVCRGTRRVCRGPRRPGAGERPERSSEQSRQLHEIQKHIACKKERPRHGGGYHRVSKVRACMIGR